MSTNYVTDGNICNEVFEANMKSLGYERNMEVENADELHFPITDGNSWTWVQLREDGSVANFTTFGRNDDAVIYNLCDACGVEVYDEHEDMFYEILERDGDEDHGLVTINLDDLLAHADEVATYDVESGEFTSVKKDGQLVN